MTAAESSVDEQMMDHAISEARKGRPSPSPRVGAAVAVGGVLFAVGHDASPSLPRAAEDAIASAAHRATGATLYCTLEPTDALGSTRPLAELIARAGIRRVVVACRDPRSSGESLDALDSLGVETVHGVRAAEGQELIADFATLARLGRPLTVLKAAMTIDGRIATRSGDSKWITSESSRKEAHALRDECDAVMVGVGTVLSDDPKLDVRLVPGRDPIRVVLDTHLRTPASAALVAHRSKSPTWIFHGAEAAAERRSALARAPDVELIEAPVTDDGRLDVRAVLVELGSRGVMRLLVEGGGRVHGALIGREVADRAVLFIAPLVLGDPEARSLVERPEPPDTIQGATRLERVRARLIGDEIRIDARFCGAPF